MSEVNKTPSKALRPVVAAAIVDSLSHPTKLLAAERSYPENLAGLYELPGGKVEPGEAPQAALEREIREELGTSLTVGAAIPGPGPWPKQEIRPGSLDFPLKTLLRSQSNSGSAISFAPWPILHGRVMWVWFAEVAPGSPSPSHHESHRKLLWLRLGEALEVPWIPANRPIIEDTLTRIAKGEAFPPT